jgi:hypothetical protein
MRRCECQMSEVHDTLSLSVRKWEGWKEDWKYKTAVFPQLQGRHVISASLQLEAHGKKEKEFTAFTESHRKKYEVLEAKLDFMHDMVSKLADRLRLSDGILQSLVHPPNLSINSF